MKCSRLYSEKMRARATTTNDVRNQNWSNDSIHAIVSFFTHKSSLQHFSLESAHSQTHAHEIRLWLCVCQWDLSLLFEDNIPFSFGFILRNPRKNNAWFQTMAYINKTSLIREPKLRGLLRQREHEITTNESHTRKKRSEEKKPQKSLSILKKCDDDNIYHNSAIIKIWIAKNFLFWIVNSRGILLLLLSPIVW